MPTRRRDLRGRGLRGTLAPPAVPLRGSRSDAFDGLVIDAAMRAAEIVGGELRWSEERKQSEIAAVRSFYGTLNALKT